MSKKNQRPKVVLTEPIHPTPTSWLENKVQLVRSPIGNPSTLNRDLKDAEGLVVRTYTRVDRQLLESTSSLKVVGRAGVGLDNIDLDVCRERGIRVVHTPDAPTQAVVEYVLGLILDALRPRVYMNRPTNSNDFHSYRNEITGTQLNQLVLGILGVGRIGSRVGKVACAMGMSVIYNDLLKPEDLNLPMDWSGTFVDKDTLWQNADILTIHADGRPENRQILDSKVLSQLKRSCLLINTSRGSLIDIPALSDWATKVKSENGMAVLDVHDPEPPDKDYPLWKNPNVKLLPHLASRTDIALENMGWVVRDVLRVIEGKDPQWSEV